MRHVAILRRAYLDAILSGQKRIESRLTRVRCDPFGRIRPGDEIFFKQSSGPFRARARALRIETYESMTPADVDWIRREHGRLILGSREYWLARREARYATLVWLADVEPIDAGPRYRRADAPAARKAWYVLSARRPAAARS